MFKRIVILVLTGLLSIMILTGCNGKSSASHVGEFVNSDASITLNEDGTFALVMNGGEMSNVKITGKYTLDGENIEFNSEKINGEELGVKSNGKISKNTITGPDGKLYTKSNSKSKANDKK